MNLEQKARIISESQTLTERIVKLQIFLSSAELDNLDAKMKELLEEQLKIMKNYRDVINSRILLMMK